VVGGLATNRVVLEAGDVGLHGALHVAGRHQRRRQVDVAVDEVWLEADGVPVVVQSLLQLALLLVDVAEVGVGLGQQRVLGNRLRGES
jgi:hypothetical protein